RAVGKGFLKPGPGSAQAGIALAQAEAMPKHNSKHKNRRPRMKTKKAQPKDVATDEAIEQILCECLTEIPFVEVDKVEQRVIADPARPEIVARIRVRGQETAILAVVKENGQPRLVREAIAKLHEYQQTYANAYGLVVARSVERSVGKKRHLRRTIYQ